MLIEVNEEWTKFVNDMVRSGRFTAPSDVVEAALENLMQNEAIASLAPADLDPAFPGIHEKVRRGLDDAKAGRLIEGDQFFDQLDPEDR